MKQNQLAHATKQTTVKLTVILIILLAPEVFVADLLYSQVLRLGTIDFLGLEIDKSFVSALSVIGFSTVVSITLFRPIGNYLKSHHKEDRIIGVNWKKLMGILVVLILFILGVSGYINSQFIQARHQNDTQLSNTTLLIASFLLSLLGVSLVICSGFLGALIAHYRIVLRLKRSIDRCKDRIEQGKNRSQELTLRMGKSTLLYTDITKELDKERRLIALKDIPMDFPDLLDLLNELNL